ncbi:MAG: PAS domain S-box protein [Deltaproteobacteria bacterium]|nr:PAS domain S-box protein [Deltaproteobacteria bacterium]
MQANTLDVDLPSSSRDIPHELFRTVFEAAPSSMLVVSEEGAITLVNTQTERLFGWRRDELVGQPVEVLIPRRIRAEHVARRTVFFATPEVRPMGAGRDLFAMRRDGSELPVEITLTPLVLREGPAVLASVVDITERKRAAERLALAVEAAPNVMILVSADGRIAMVNSQVERVFGWAREDLLGQPIETLVPARFRDGHPTQRASFFRSPSTRPMGGGRDLFGVRKDGTELPVEIGLNPIQTADGFFVLAAVIDITQRKQAEHQLRASLAEKETLLKEIHHRVKNNLQLVSSLLKLQSRKLDDPRLLAVFQEAQDRVRAMALIHQKLYQSPNVAQIPAGDYLKSLVSLVAHTYAPLAPNVHAEVSADRVWLTPDVALPLGLIVNELVSNGFKHAFANVPAGQLTISLRAPAADRRVLTVADDGIGVPEGFAPDAGSSLGLRLVGYMLEQLGATMSMSREGGTRFDVSFTVEPSTSGEDLHGR